MYHTHKSAQERTEKHKHYASEKRLQHVIEEEPYGNKQRYKVIKQYINAMVVFTNPEHTMSYFINHVILTQHGMKNGIELWVERNLKAVKREMGQFHDHRMMSWINLKTINTANKKKALAYLMFLKQKQSGIIKGQ